MNLFSHDLIGILLNRNLRLRRGRDMKKEMLNILIWVTSKPQKNIILSKLYSKSLESR